MNRMRKTLTERDELRESLRKWLVDATGCGIHSGMIEGKMQDWGWPCGTCFFDLLERLGLDSTQPAYKERDSVVDRANEVWRAIIQIREGDGRG